MLRYRQNSELYHGVSKTKFMFLRLGDFRCSRQYTDVVGRGLRMRRAKIWCPPTRITRYLVVHTYRKEPLLNNNRSGKKLGEIL